MFWIITGGTGGHIIPALSLSLFLREKDIPHRLFYSQSPIASSFIDSAVDAVPLPSIPQPRRSALRFIHSVIDGGCVSRLEEFYDEDRPQKAVLFGGYMSLPAFFFLLKRKVPMVVHEQNAVLGDANRFMSFWAKEVWAGLPHYAFPKGIAQKASFTGNYFITPDRFNDVLAKGQNPTPPREGIKTVLLFGGSQGAFALNLLAIDIAKHMPEDWRLVHITGQRDYGLISGLYQKEGVKVTLIPFVFPLSRWIAKADIIISRAGALSLTEAAFYIKPLIAVAYPYAKGHQWRNIEALVREDSVVGVRQKGDWQAKVIDSLISLVKKDAKRQALARRLNERGICNIDMAQKTVGRSLGIF